MTECGGVVSGLHYFFVIFTMVASLCLTLTLFLSLPPPLLVVPPVFVSMPPCLC